MSVKNSVCKKCRRVGEKLMLKGDRCMTPKCAFAKRAYAPGKSGNSRAPKLSDFGVQLKEKQKAKSIYNIREKQFKKYYLNAAKTKEASGEKLLQLLEMRFDNVVFKVGYAPSIRAARQMVRHKKFKINDKKINIPSYGIGKGDKLEPILRDGFKMFKTEIPVWVKFDKGKLVTEIIKIPERNEINNNINEDLIVEFYSR